MKNKIIQKSIRFPTELVELIEKIAKIERRNLTNLVNKIIEDHFFTDVYYSKEIVDLINEWQKTYRK